MRGEEVDHAPDGRRFEIHEEIAVRDASRLFAGPAGPLRATPGGERSVVPAQAPEPSGEMPRAPAVGQGASLARASRHRHGSVRKDDRLRVRRWAAARRSSLEELPARSSKRARAAGSLRARTRRPASEAVQAMSLRDRPA